MKPCNDASMTLFKSEGVAGFKIGLLRESADKPEDEQEFVRLYLKPVEAKPEPEPPAPPEEPAPEAETDPEKDRSVAGEELPMLPPVEKAEGLEGVKPSDPPVDFDGEGPVDQPATPPEPPQADDKPEEVRPPEPPLPQGTGKFDRIEDDASMSPSKPKEKKEDGNEGSGEDKAKAEPPEAPTLNRKTVPAPKPKAAHKKPEKAVELTRTDVVKITRRIKRAEGTAEEAKLLADARAQAIRTIRSKKDQLDGDVICILVSFVMLLIYFMVVAL
jgi:hypothetical protein